MHSTTKKWIIAGAIAVITLGMLTACTKVTEKKDDAETNEESLPEDGGGVSEIGDDPDGTKITVVYSMDTEFVKQTLRDGGANSEEREGSAADLKKDCIVKLTGSYYDENIFFATDVKIVEII